MMRGVVCVFKNCRAIEDGSIVVVARCHAGLDARARAPPSSVRLWRGARARRGIPRVLSERDT